MQPQQQNSELDPNSYPHPVSSADHQLFESQMMSQMQRPNSIEVCTCIYTFFCTKKVREIVT